MPHRKRLTIDAPDVVLERLALYHCLLQEWLLGGRTKPITSRELAVALGLTDETVRRDLSFLKARGGKPGVGYDPRDLFGIIGKRLQMETRVPVLIVGSARIVEALFTIFSLEKFGFVAEAFYSENPQDAGKLFRGTEVRQLTTLPDHLGEHEAKLALLATHPDWTQYAIDALGGVGIKGILNLTPMVIANAPAGVDLMQLRYPCYLKVLAFKASQNGE